MNVSPSSPDSPWSGDTRYRGDHTWVRERTEGSQVPVGLGQKERPHQVIKPRKNSDPAGIVGYVTDHVAFSATSESRYDRRWYDTMVVTEPQCGLETTKKTAHPLKTRITSHQQVRKEWELRDTIKILEEEEQNPQIGGETIGMRPW